MKTSARRLFRKLNPFRPRPGNKLDVRAAYLRLMESLKHSHGDARAAELAVGGEFEALGFLELETLRHFGLTKDSYLIDVGCGSGRLAKPLSAFSTGKYLGLDIVPELLDHARRIVERPDWRFEVAEGLSIPEEDGAADMVCFFSVFTHLLHEQSYVYLREAGRVLKPGGRVVFSFLDFTIAEHWPVFEFNVRDIGRNSHPLNVFIGKDAIPVWAGRLGLRVEAVEDGNKAYVPLSRPVTFEGGSVAEKLGTIGQSVCVLSK
jgi:SAM-dependent methyltransferase